MPKTIDLLGQKFASLTVVGRVVVPKGKDKWVCVCDCGGEINVIGASLKSGITTVCHKCTVKSRTVHGDCGTALYNCWNNIKRRCLNPKNPEYHNYGGRGITICKEWLKSYLAFKNDMGESYAKGLSIDRIDNNKGYYKDNCRWVTCKTQLRNMRKNRIVETPMGRMVAAEVAELVGLSSSGIKYRIDNGLYTDDVFRPSRKIKKAV